MITLQGNLIKSISGNFHAFIFARHARHYLDGSAAASSVAFRTEYIANEVCCFKPAKDEFTPNNATFELRIHLSTRSSAHFIALKAAIQDIRYLGTPEKPRSTVAQLVSAINTR